MARIPYSPTALNNIFINLIAMKLEERLDLLKQKVQNDDFLCARGLGNEIPFWIFDYPPEKELLVRDTIDKITLNFGKTSVNVVVIDLFEMCLELLNNKLSNDTIFEFENKKGSDELLKKLKIMLKPEIIKKAIQVKMESSGDVQLMFLTGVGKAWPLVRSHSILNNLQPVLGNVPLVTFYPGKYDNYELSLFGKFKDGNYYRAFPLINEEISGIRE
jgi:predicted house-cleaning noncanonical NTP pyrophosphatase (MazG superfamily)